MVWEYWISVQRNFTLKRTPRSCQISTLGLIKRNQNQMWFLHPHISTSSRFKGKAMLKKVVVLENYLEMWAVSLERRVLWFSPTIPPIRSSWESPREPVIELRSAWKKRKLASSPLWNIQTLVQPVLGGLKKGSSWGILTHIPFS